MPQMFQLCLQDQHHPSLNGPYPLPNSLPVFFTDILSLTSSTPQPSCFSQSRAPSRSYTFYDFTQSTLPVVGAAFSGHVAQRTAFGIAGHTRSDRGRYRWPMASQSASGLLECSKIEFVIDPRGSAEVVIMDLLTQSTAVLSAPNPLPTQLKHLLLEAVGDMKLEELSLGYSGIPPNPNLLSPSHLSVRSPLINHPHMHTHMRI